MPESNPVKIKHWLWAILGISVALRVSAVLILGDGVVPLPGIYDQISYQTLATRVLGGHGFTFPVQWWPLTRAGEPTAHWSFLYTLFLTGIYTIIGVHPLAARLVQAVITGLAGPWLAFRLAVAVYQRTESEVKTDKDISLVALFAAAWVAVYGYFIYYAAAMMTESFFIISIMWSLDCAIRLLNRGNWFGFLELGLAVGTAVLLRQTYLVMLPMIILWLGWAVFRRGRVYLSMRSVILGSAGTVLVIGLLIGPFSYYNFKRFGHFVLLNTNAGYAFFWSNHPVHGVKFVPLFTPDMPSYQSLIPVELRHLDEVSLDQELLKLGLKFVLADPQRFFLLTLSRIPIHFQFWPVLTSGLVSNLTRVFSIGIALPFMVAGGWLWFQDARRGLIYSEAGVLLVVFILVFTALHIISWASVRYRLPTDAVGLVFAARSLFALLERLFPKKIYSLPIS